MQINEFSIARLPRIIFGNGSIKQLPDITKPYGNTFLIIIGSGSITQNPSWEVITTWLSQQGIQHWQENICDEPSPEIVDEITARHRDHAIDLVLGIGGGSVMDAAKAIAGLLRIPHSVMDFLEGVGPELPYPGPSTPFIAIPTTAGTGSEATKNAVLSKMGKNGFKKSFRDEQLVPDYAILDPELLASCPAELIAANGMDALTQIMESFVSTRANIMTDSLAVSGLRACREGLLDWFNNTGDTQNARSLMAYASLVSGINLAQTGLGSVHGLASPLGAFFPIPHGVVCGTLLASATRINIEVMLKREPENPALKKYARMATLLCNCKFPDQQQAFDSLLEQLYEWTTTLQLPKLSRYGVEKNDFPLIIQHCRGSSMKTNPVVLADEEVALILEECL